jgi:hypothetical protein
VVDDSILTFCHSSRTRSAAALIRLEALPHDLQALHPLAGAGLLAAQGH